MRKNISAAKGIAKKSLIGVVMVGAMGLSASSPIKNNERQNSGTQTTELLSKPAAEAVKSLTMPPQNKHQGFYNLQLNITLKQFAKNEADLENINKYLEKMYKNLGPCLGSTMIQNEIDHRMLYAFLDGDMEVLKKLKKFKGDKLEYSTPDQPLMKPVYENKEAVKNWYKNTYVPAIKSVLNFNHQPSDKELDSALASLPEKLGFKFIDIVVYNMFMNDYAKKQYAKDISTESHTDYFAYQMHLINELAISYCLRNTFYPDDEKGYQTPAGKEFDKYFSMWFDAVKPLL